MRIGGRKWETVAVHDIPLANQPTETKKQTERMQGNHRDTISPRIEFYRNFVASLPRN